MSLALRNTDVSDYQFFVDREGGGRVSCLTSVGTSVINLDRSQEAPVPEGAELLDSFLDQFEARDDIAPYLDQASKEVAAVFEASDGAVTLQTLRLRQGLSQKQLATAIGTSQAAISDLERRIKKPTEDKIRALVSALDVDFNTLMDALANADT